MTLAINEIFLLGKSNEWMGYSVYCDSFSWKWHLRGNCGDVSCTWGNWVFHQFMHSKQIYEPRETLGILLSLEITLLPIKPFLPYYPLRIPLAWIMGYKDNTWFFARFLMAFVGNMNIYLAAYPLVEILAAYHRAWPRSLLHVLWPDRDPLLFSLLLLLLFLYFSFFLGFWAFTVLLSFMNWALFC